MQSKTSFFNRTLFFDLFKRYWPIFASYLALLLIFFPASLPSVLHFTAYPQETTPAIFEASYHVLNMVNIGGTIISAVFCVVIAMAAFSYLFNARSASMMCSLPIKREGVFLTFFTSSLFWLFLANLITFIAVAAVEASYSALNLGMLLQAFAMLTLLNVFFMGFACLCASLTGHVFVLPILYVILNFAVVVIETLVRSILNVFVYGLSMSETGTTFMAFSPIANIFANNVATYTMPEVNAIDFDAANSAQHAITGVEYSGFTTIIIYALVGLVFAGLAMVLIKRRRMETAGDVVAVAPLKPILKYCLTFGCALVIGSLLFFSLTTNSDVGGLGTVLTLLALMLFGGFIGYFASEMLLNKTLRVFAPNKWKGFCVSAAIIILLMSAAEFDLFGYERNVPAPEDVESLSINCNGEFANFELPENIEDLIALHHDLIAKKPHYDSANDRNDGQLMLRYSLKGDKYFSRDYMIDLNGSDEAAVLQDLLNTDEAIASRLNTGLPVATQYIYDSYVDWFNPEVMAYQTVSITPSAAMNLYETCIVPDIADHGLGEISLVRDGAYFKDTYACTIDIVLRQRLVDRVNNGNFHVTVTTQSQRTLKWLQEKNILPITEAKVQELSPTDVEYAANAYPLPAQSTTTTPTDIIS